MRFHQLEPSNVVSLIEGRNGLQGLSRDFDLLDLDLVVLKLSIYIFIFCSRYGLSTTTDLLATLFRVHFIFILIVVTTCEKCRGNRFNIKSN